MPRITLYRVLGIRHGATGRIFVTVNGGMSDNPRPSLYGARYTAWSDSKPPPGPDHDRRYLGRCLPWAESRTARSPVFGTARPPVNGDIAEADTGIMKSSSKCNKETILGGGGLKFCGASVLISPDVGTSSFFGISMSEFCGVDVSALF